MVVNIIVNYCGMYVCCTRKMLKETDSEETIKFFATFLSLVAFQLGGGGNPGPPVYAFEPKCCVQYKDM